jgi:hypothetical protein
MHISEEAMSRRSNSTKQKNKAKFGRLFSERSTLSQRLISPQSPSAFRRKCWPHRCWKRITSAREVDGVFSDYSSVNKEILESASVASSSIQSASQLALNEMDAIEVPCDNAAVSATAVLEPEDDEYDFDTDFGANIFADDEPASAQTTSYAEISRAMLQELKASESATRDEAAKTLGDEQEIWDEISLEDCCFDESPELEQPSFEKTAAHESETGDSGSADWNTSEDLDSDADPNADDVGEEIFEAENSGEHSRDAVPSSNAISAIDAAVEILSQAVDTEDILQIPSSDTTPLSDLIPSSDPGVQRHNFEYPLRERPDLSGDSLKKRTERADGNVTQ